MEINVHRKWFTKESTTSEVYYSIDGDKKTLACYCLEDAVRDGDDGILQVEEKIHGATAIPTGRYRVVVSYSTRFKQIMPELLNVPHFSGIRIHVGNTDKNTDGCLLFGRSRDFNFIVESLMAYASFCHVFCEAINRGDEVWINIHGVPKM